MSRNDEDSPVYYREIQKNAYLKRIPEETGGSKLRPLGHKKPPLKPMWTLFCVHNGRVPYIEQYPSIDAPCTASHRPLWRACLRTARHVTASVTPRGNEHDFLIHTDSGPLRLLAPDWESMQDWVTTLRSKLHELKILGAGENVYCAAPAAPPPRAPARDPTSPLPPTPPHPPQRVPGIEIVTPIPRPLPATVEPPTQPVPEPSPQPPTTHTAEPPLQTIPTEDIEPNIDISDWDTTLNLSSLPSTSNAKQSKDNTRKKLKICGQNICLDNSIFNRTNTSSDDEEFFSELDRINSDREDLQDSDGSRPKKGEDGVRSASGLRRLTIDAEEIGLGGTSVKSSAVEKDEVGESSGFKQRLVIGRESKTGASQKENGEYQSTNITVIQVSNKPPHTAIPVLGPETDVFNFDFKHNFAVNPAGASETNSFKQNFAVKPSEEAEKASYKQNFAVKPSEEAEKASYKQNFAVKPSEEAEKASYKQNFAVKPSEEAEKASYKQNFAVKPSEEAEKASYKQNFAVKPCEEAEKASYKQNFAVKPCEEAEKASYKQNFAVKPSEEAEKASYKQNFAVKPCEEAEKASYKQNFAVKPCEEAEKASYKQNFAVKPSEEAEKGSYKQNFAVKPIGNTENVTEKYVNVVNTEAGIDNKYGTVFADDPKESDYGHISLTTTVSLTGAANNDISQSEGIYERLCQASTSTNLPSPQPLRKLRSHEKARKSSLPNLDLTAPNSMNQTYEYLYPGPNPNMATKSSKTTNANVATPNSSAHVASNSSLATPSLQNMATPSLQNMATPANPGRSAKCHRDYSDQVSSVAENTSSITNAGLLRPQNPRGNYVSSVPVSGANIDVNSDAVRSNIERSHSQNAYDSPRLRDRFIRKENAGRSDVKNESKPAQTKPIWKRGLTELSLLSRLRGIGQGKRAESPTKNDSNDRNPISPPKALPRSRRDNGGDSTRRRSSSLSNGQPPLLSVRAREAAALQAAQARGAATPGRLPRAHAPLLCEHDGALWVAWWAGCGSWLGGRSGDRLAALRGRAVCTLQHARSLLQHPPTSKIDILFHRVPLAKIYILYKESDDENIGIKLDNDCSISSVEAGSPAARAGLPPSGAWAVTECNNRPLNLVKGGQDDLNRLSACGKEISVLIQPVALVKKLRATMKANKSLLGLR